MHVELFHRFYAPPPPPERRQGRQRVESCRLQTRPLEPLSNHWPLFPFALVYSSCPLPPSLLPPPFLGALSTVLFPIPGPVVDILGGLLPPAVDASVTPPPPPPQRNAIYVDRTVRGNTQPKEGVDGEYPPPPRWRISTISNSAHLKEGK